MNEALDYIATQCNIGLSPEGIELIESAIHNASAFNEYELRHSKNRIDQLRFQLWFSRIEEYIYCFKELQKQNVSYAQYMNVKMHYYNKQKMLWDSIKMMSTLNC